MFYKRNGCNIWRGPGIVIGRDGKQVIVKHGGSMVRVHICRLNSSGVERSPEQAKFSDTDVLEEQMKSCPPEVEQEQFESDSEFQAPFENLNPISGNDSETLSPINTDRLSDNVQPSDGSTNLAYSFKDVKGGDRISGILLHSGEPISGIIKSRAGKATAKSKYCWNISKSDGSQCWYDFKNDIGNLCKVSEDEELLVFYNSADVQEAKQREIHNWN